MRYPPYALPTWSGVSRLGVFTRAEGGFAQLRWSLDMFQTRGMELIIQLGAVTLRPRDTARSNDVDHVRRMLGARQQVMFVCASDHGRAEALSQSGVRGARIRAVRHNLFHLDPGFTAKLGSGDLFAVVGECDAPANGMNAALQNPRMSREGGDRIGVAVSATGNHAMETVRQLHPKVLISTGTEPSDEVISLSDGAPDRPTTHLVTLGTAASAWGDHAIVDVRTAAVESIAGEILEALARSQKPEAHA